jgi:hypothetical protein
MFCGLPSLKVLLSSILPAKDMVTSSSSSSSSKSTRRQSCATFTLESPSQNTRAAKKRRLKQQLHKKPAEAISTDNNNLALMAAAAQTLTSNANQMAFSHPVSQLQPLAQAPNHDERHIFHLAQMHPAQLFPHEAIGSSPAYSIHHGFNPDFEGHERVLSFDDSAYSNFHVAPLLPHEMLQPYPSYTQSDVVMGNAGDAEKGVTQQEGVDFEMRDVGATEAKLEMGLQEVLKAPTDVTTNAGSTSHDQNAKTWFTDVPLEIRRLIFKHTVPTVIGRPYTRDATDTVAWVKGNIDLLCVNKQIYHETMDYMWNNLVVEFDVNNTGVSLNTTAKAGNALQPKSKSCGEDMAKLTIPISRARNVVINVPDVTSLEDWDSLVKHQAAVRADGAIALKPHLEKLVSTLAEREERLQHVQVNLRDWTEPVESAFALLTPLLTGVKAASTVTVYQQSDFDDWPWTSMEVVNEWQVQKRSDSIKKWILTMENGAPRATLVRRPLPPPKPVIKKENQEDVDSVV